MTVNGESDIRGTSTTTSCSTTVIGDTLPGGNLLVDALHKGKTTSEIEEEVLAQRQQD